MTKFLLLTLSLIFVCGAEAKSTTKKTSAPRTVSSMRDQAHESFSYVYDESKDQPTITFKSSSGEVLGIYKSKHNLFMNEAAVVKINDHEFLVTSWPNGNATYNIRVFLPKGKKRWFSGKSFVNSPICDIGLEGDIPDFTKKEPKLIYNTVNGKPNFSVLVNNFKKSRYQSCP